MNLIPKTLLLLFVLSHARYACAESVELNVVPTDRASFGAAQKWALALNSLRNVRVRSNTNQRPREELKWEGSTLYITALIGPRDELVVPGRTFSIRQTKSLAAWIESQKKAHRDSGQEPKDQRFGLTSSEIQRVHRLLKPAVIKSTKAVGSLQCVRDVVRSHGLPIQFDKRAQQLVGDGVCKTEWQGFSLGTALAGILRQHELALVPKVESGRVRLQVRPEGMVKDSWPVGWPPELKKQEVVPKLFDTLPIEIFDTPIRDVMRALESRLDTPIVFDEGMLAAAELDPDKTKVTVQLNRSFYGKVIRQAAFNAKMKSEVRTDERGKGFFWITAATIKR